MEHLIFICPKTGRNVDGGFATEIATLLRIRKSMVKAKCSACGGEHVWPVQDAFLAEAA
ncbi:MAG TPA: hypothetical protein VNQ99_14670 [Xanthobacteraceae bacterium]|nr:hypothetical protein [Xanthobacteraceae bacterium]